LLGGGKIRIWHFIVELGLNFIDMPADFAKIATVCGNVGLELQKP
jgi:hypothetical protein